MQINQNCVASMGKVANMNISQTKINESQNWVMRVVNVLNIDKKVHRGTDKSNLASESVECKHYGYEVGRQRW